MNNEKQVAVLNDLITRCYDAENGYKEAIDNVNSTQVKSIFQDLSTQRYDFGHQLKREIKSLGGNIEKGGSTQAAIHRTWIDLKSSFASNEDEAVLSEVIRGENYALESYSEALKELKIGTSAYDTVVKQRNAIRSAIARMESLENVAEASVK
jgi:uncharacterized protein (TIGR02284 family)